jgi:hypothetical protein
MSASLPRPRGGTRELILMGCYLARNVNEIKVMGPPDYDAARRDSVSPRTGLVPYRPGAFGNRSGPCP